MFKKKIKGVIHVGSHECEERNIYINSNLPFNHNNGNNGLFNYIRTKAQKTKSIKTFINNFI